MWIALGVIALVIILAFAFVGAPHLFRTTPVRHVVDFGSDATTLDFESPAPPEAVRLACRTGLEAGTAAEILNDGDGTFPRLSADLKAARVDHHCQLLRQDR